MSPSLSQVDLQACLPDVTSTLAFPELTEAVTIYRDKWGIPHISAANEPDLFCAQGFAAAQDRLWHMDADRHQALGRWSEFVGSSGLERDRLLRAAGMGRTAKLDLQVCGDKARQMADAYTAGVNAFIRTTATLPIEYRLLGNRTGAVGELALPGGVQDSQFPHRQLRAEALSHPPGGYGPSQGAGDHLAWISSWPPAHRTTRGRV